MTRSQLITKVANDTNMTSAEVEKVMDGIFGTIGDVLKSVDQGHQQAGAHRYPRLQGQRPSEGEGWSVILPPNIGFNARGRCAAGFFVCYGKKNCRQILTSPAVPAILLGL